MKLDTVAIAQFTSKSSSAGVVNVEFGFAPDFAIMFADIDGTNPNILFWGNAAELSLWTTALSLLLTGSSGIVTRDTSGIALYAGGDAVASAETVNTDGKHVTEDGTAAAAGHITAAGLAIPADHQVASGKNVVLAFRRSR